jgi:putative ABC transport system substrate-binding protein
MVNEFKKEADLVGLTVVESVALKTSDVSSASKHLVGKVDAIYIPNDNTAVSAMSSITQVGVDNKIPVFVGDVAFEKEATAIAGFDRFKLGKKLASVVIRILNGEEASSIPVEVDHPVKVILNKTNANRIGLSFSQEQLKDVSVIE